ncbi:MAG: hypothetical protein ACREH8_12680 [Opitutaceae bacterium]
MTYGIVFWLLLQGDVIQAIAQMREQQERQAEKLWPLIAQLLQGPLSPQAIFRFEQEVQAVLREGGRQILETVLNTLEASEHPEWPTHVTQEGETYRRRVEPTPHEVSTVFGPVTLQRLGYRSDAPEEPSVFPLEETLGLRCGCTPALAERVGFHAGQAGATQRTVLDLLRRDHGIAMGVGRLRQLLESLSEATAPMRREAQAGRVRDLLQQAFAQKGRGLPTLAVGRDGITVGNQPHGFFEVATCATVSVHDRKGRRLGTVSLGFAPELGQQTMTEELLALVQEILRGWSGPLPQLAYISDAGDQEEAFYTRRLCRMRHPVTKARLKWQRVVDYYHAASRLTTIADALNLDEAAGKAWARHMRRVLKAEPNAIHRILHSAAALKQRYGTKNKTQAAAFETACSYLRRRSVWMRYNDFREAGLPIGSGVTEAACKTLFTQRVKLSGMRWKRSGLQTVLNLRMLVLSGVWAEVYARTLTPPCITVLPAQRQVSPEITRKAA